MYIRTYIYIYMSININMQLYIHTPYTYGRTCIREDPSFFLRLFQKPKMWWNQQSLQWSVKSLMDLLGSVVPALFFRFWMYCYVLETSSRNQRFTGTAGPCHGFQCSPYWIYRIHWALQCFWPSGCLGMLLRSRKQTKVDRIQWSL